MYCTVQDITNLLPASITIGDTNLGTPSPGVSTTKRSSITNDKAIFCIKKAQEEIDSRLRSFYVTPLRRIKITETLILSDAIAGNNVNVDIYDTGAWTKGDQIEIRNNDVIDVATVKDVPSMRTLTLDTLPHTFYQADDALISLMEFPDPIPLITARLAVAIAYDTLFVADQEPNVSSYGNTQRQLALNDLDGILDGTIKLYGQEHTGRRFIRGSLFDAFRNATKDFQFGREKPSSGGG